jgi:hypothetical protein
LIDISEGDPDVLFTLGVLTAVGIPTVLICATSSTQQHERSILTTADRRIIAYESIDQLPVDVFRAFVQLARAFASHPVLPPNDLASLWFGEEAHDLHVVGPPEHQKSEFANPSAPNYIYIDNLGDRDSLLEVLMFLSKHYPRSILYKYSSEDFPPKFLERDLVILGGPGIPGMEPGNSLCRLMSERGRMTVSYNPDGECAYFNGREWKTQYDAKNRITRDFGYFARMPNPFDHRSTVILIHGSHTLGVLGAVRAFSDHPNANENIASALSMLGGGPMFESGFYVDIHEGAVLCPLVESILPLTIKD